MESPFCLWKCNNAAIPLWSQNRKSEWQTRSSKMWRKNRNVFCAFACTHQSKRQESLWTSRTADKNNLRIHQTTCISFTDSRMDRCQTVKNSCTDSGPLLLHKHPSFTFVCVFVWEIRFQSDEVHGNSWSWHLLSWYHKKGGVTCKVPALKHTWIGLQSFAVQSLRLSKRCLLTTTHPQWKDFTPFSLL